MRCWCGSDWGSDLCMRVFRSILFYAWPGFLFLGFLLSGPFEKLSCVRNQSSHNSLREISWFCWLFECSLSRFTPPKKLEKYYLRRKGHPPPPSSVGLLLSSNDLRLHSLFIYILSHFNASLVKIAQNFSGISIFQTIISFLLKLYLCPRDFISDLLYFREFQFLTWNLLIQFKQIELCVYPL